MATCPSFRVDNEPCWGEELCRDEIVTDDDTWCLMACEGHRDFPTFGGPYYPQPEDKRWTMTPSTAG